MTLDGSEPLPDPEETTAGRIVAAGGSARASSVSVTDGEAVRRLFRELVDEHGGLDAVVNVAGITRQTYFGKGTEEDWLAVLAVHLEGYLNVLDAALPLMAAAGYGRILGVTSGSGWREADAGPTAAPSGPSPRSRGSWAARRPPGVTVNAMSPIAATRMMASALERARKAGRSGGGGISFLTVADPEDLGPFGAYLVGEEFGWCSGQVLFAGGPRWPSSTSPASSRWCAPTPWSPSPGCSTMSSPRRSPSRGQPGQCRWRQPPVRADLRPAGRPRPPSTDVRSCVVVSDRPPWPRRSSPRSRPGPPVPPVEPVRGFGEPPTPGPVVDADGPVDAVVVAAAGRPPAASSPDGWERVLAEHREIVEELHADAGWARATADYAAAPSVRSSW